MTRPLHTPVRYGGHQDVQCGDRLLASGLLQIVLRCLLVPIESWQRRGDLHPVPLCLWQAVLEFGQVTRVLATCEGYFLALQVVRTRCPQKTSAFFRPCPTTDAGEEIVKMTTTKVEPQRLYFFLLQWRVNPLSATQLIQLLAVTLLLRTLILILVVSLADLSRLSSQPMRPEIAQLLVALLLLGSALQQHRRAS